MKRLVSSIQPRLFALLAITLSIGIYGCGKDNPTVNQVGVNVVDKSLFTGSWYYSRTVIDVDYASAGIGTFQGDTASDFGDDSFSALPRVRWVIDEDTLFAYRDYEVIEGGNPESDNATPGNYLGSPVAAFGIGSHFDIRRAYSTVTGEERNVLVENATDRRWYERDYMRVDWSMNLLPGYYNQTFGLFELFGAYSREPAQLFVQGASDFPDSWQPQFHFMGCADINDANCSELERDFAEDYEQGELYSFDFVTQELISPGSISFFGQSFDYCLVGGTNCNTNAVFVRNAFLKVSDTRQYEPVNWVDTRFERAGYFRNERLTFDRQTSAEDPAFRSTDFLNFNANRFNIWREWRDEAGNAIPFAERRVRPIVYYNTSEMPAHIVRPSFEVAGVWNGVFMKMIRNVQGKAEAVYPAISCQTTDPDAYCYCVSDPDDASVILNPQCPGVYDPFETPDEAAARGVSNPYQCHVQVPEGAEPNLDSSGGAFNVNDPGLTDAMYNGWFGAEMVGEECGIVLRNNSCNRANGQTPPDGETCQERGDARIKFISYVDQPGTGFLGIATLRGDPITGELLVGDANIGGPALDGYRTSAMQAYDIINGTIDEKQFIYGEDVRSYLENLNAIQQPARPRTDFLEALNARGNDQFTRTMKGNIDRQMSNFVSRAEQLEGPEGRAKTFDDLRYALAGSDIEQRVMANEETLMMAGMNAYPDIDITTMHDSILDKVSPFRTDIHKQMSDHRDRATAFSKANVMMPNEFVDHSIMEFVNRHRDWPRARLEMAINRMLYFNIQLHEFGHCVGLRHSFGSSADPANYGDGYYQINERFPLPDPRNYDSDGTNGLSPIEQVAFETDYQATKRRRELAGIDRWMSTSTMEYTAQWYHNTLTQAGRYDHAAVNFGYADLAEVYDNSANARTFNEITPANTPRLWAKFYQGGEECQVDTDCPFSDGGVNAGELLTPNRASGLTQKCIAHPGGEAGQGKYCSNFDDDAAKLVTDPAGTPQFAPVEYRYCTDDRVGTIGWCHRFDEGDSYREIISNLSEQYDRDYIFTNFRRYRANFSFGSSLGRFFRYADIMQSVFQNLLFNYQVDPEFRNETGPFGFYDQFLASVDVMNFYGKVMASPRIGGYSWDEGNQRYRISSLNPEDGQLGIPLGMGRYFSSIYQTGLTGIRRIERVGSFFEKFITMQLLATRGWVSGYGRDLPFWTNYNDLFPLEMQQIFQGIIQERPESISPRIQCGSGEGRVCNDPKLIYMDFYRGDCSAGSTTCRPDPVDNYSGFPLLEGGAAASLQYLASLYALSSFPVFFDTSFQNQLFICIDGNGECFEPSDTATEGVDYVEYFSERYGKTFRAWQVEPSESVSNATSIGFAMVKEASDSAFIVETMQRISEDPANILPLTPAEEARLSQIGYTIPAANTDAFFNERNRLFRRVIELESFFFQLIQLERELGIASYLGFRG